MGHLLHIILAIAAQALGEAGLTLGWSVPSGVLALALVPHLLGLAARRCAVAGRFRLADLLGNANQHSAPALFLIAVVCCGWIGIVRDWTGSGLDLFGWPSPSMLLGLVPYALFELLAIDAQARLNAAGPRDLRRLRAFQFRMFFASLLPLAAYLSLAGSVALVPDLRVMIERISLWNAAFLGLLIVCLMLLLPTLLRHTWETAPLPPGPQREKLMAVAARAGFRAREVLVWRTGHLMANAAIVGLFARQRVVLFSDSLLSLMDLNELASVFGHEIGHAKRRHVVVFMCWAMAFFMGFDLAGRWALQEDVLGARLEAWGVDGLLLESLGIVFLALLLGIGYVAFGWLSRRCELEADLYSLELLGDPLALITALERVSGSQRDVSGWRHFSTAKRVSFIHQAALEPGFGRRFRAPLRKLAWLGGVLAFCLAGLETRGLLAVYPEERVLADLCLGEYELAEQRLREIEGADEELAVLAAEATRLANANGGAIELADLASALIESVQRKRLAEALVRADLLSLRGDVQVRPVIAVLHALGVGQVEIAEEGLETLDDLWRGRLAPLVAEARRMAE